MNTQTTKTNTYTDNKADVSTVSFGSDNPMPGYSAYNSHHAKASSTLKLEQDLSENQGGDEEEITGLPLEAMVISNSSLCSFMGARSPWPNT